ncbi:hypothetical protein ND748_31120 [Frankia sp. AiPs1]|uniref:hypothetical protein n=1 Tax=Frankia sp. AiPs1 TaxID=573493 RepID=UPI0020443A37|nr:hypothetical protein [Frankia sp. AiPs1]MCM3926107.1 hypothetical protein [Frankia sp. AiPs1]
MVAGPGGDLNVHAEDLYTHSGDVSTAASHLRQDGLTALMMIAQLGSGGDFAPGSVDSLVHLHTQHLLALSGAQTALGDTVAGLGVLGQGAGLIGANYQASDEAAARRINGALVDRLLAPPPPGEQVPDGVQVQEVPLTPEEQRQIAAIGTALGGRGGGGATRTFSSSTGAVTVTVPAVPAMSAPPIPGRPSAGAPAAPAQPGAPQTFTTGGENDLSSDGVCFTSADSPAPGCWDERARRRPALP